MWAPLNRRETVLRHASPPSKKRKPAKIGCSSFEEAQHPVASDRCFRWSFCVLCRVRFFCSLVCFSQTRCRAALAQPSLLLVGVFSGDTLSCGSGAVHSWSDWRCVALPTGAGFLRADEPGCSSASLRCVTGFLEVLVSWQCQGGRSAW